MSELNAESYSAGLRILQSSALNFKPQQQQKSVWDELKNPDGARIMYIGGSIGGGKTLNACGMAAWAAVMNPELYRNIYFLGPDLRHLSEVVYNYLFEDEMFRIDNKLAEALIPQDFILGGRKPGDKLHHWQKVDLKSGSTIHCLSYEMANQVFQGFTADLIVADECPRRPAAILAQLRSRLTKSLLPYGGRLIVAATSEVDTADDFMELRRRVESGDEPRSKFYKWTYDKVEHKTDEEKKAFWDSLPEEERTARYYGGISTARGPIWVIGDINKVTREQMKFDGLLTPDGMHLTRRMVPELSVDPAGRQNLYAVILMATDIQTGKRYFLDEYAQKQQTSHTVMPHIARMLARWGISAFGGLWRITCDYAGIGTAQVSEKESIDVLLPTYGIHTQTLGPFTQNCSKVDRENALREMRDEWREGRLLILDGQCPRLLREAQSFCYDKNGVIPPRHKSDDCIDAARYAVKTPGGPDLVEPVVPSLQSIWPKAPGPWIVEEDWSEENGAFEL